MNAEDLKNLTPEQFNAYVTALAQVENQKARSQKGRAFAQGATFGFSDEAEAAVKSLIGEKTYKENVDEIRSMLSQYRSDAPIESIAYEVAGAFAPALLSRGRSAPLSMTQIVGRAAGEGALSGYGTSEGDIIQQLTQTATGAGAGAAFGTAASYGMKLAGGLVDKVVDSMRRLTGGRGATAVENEILRLAEQSGETPDQIVARIARGEIMADNKSLQMALRDLMAKGGISEDEIRTLLPQRAESLRLEAQAGLKSGLSPESGSNVLKSVRMKEDDFQKAMGRAYDQVFSAGIEVPQLGDTLVKSLQRVPDAQAVLNKVFKSEGGLVPPYKFNDDGSIELVRVPTLQDAEITRRAVKGAVDLEYKSGIPDVAKNLKSVERELRGMIDSASPELSTVRSQYSRMMDMRNTFEEGRKAFNLPPEQLDIDFGRIADDPELVAAYREGIMAQINNKLARTGGKQMMRKLSDPNTLEGKLFDTVFPEGMKRQVMNKILTSSAAQKTYEKVIEGSTTYLGQQAGKQANKGIALDEVMGAARMNPRDLIQVGAKLVNSMAPELTDAQRKQITDVLISRDPDFVRRALTDESVMARLQNQIQLFSRRLQATAGTAGAISGGTLGSSLSGQYFGE